MSWSANLAAVDAAVAGYFDGDACTAVAMTKPLRSVNAEAAPDPSRESFDFLGTIEIEPSFQDISSGGGRPSAGDRQFRQVSQTCLTALTTGWPWVPRQGDQVVCAGQRYSVVASPDRDGTGRIALWLNKVI